MMKPVGNGKGAMPSASGSAPVRPSLPHIRQASVAFSNTAVPSIKLRSRRNAHGMCTAPEVKVIKFH